MDEDPLQHQIYFLAFIDSLDIIFSRYIETFEVLLDHPKIGGDNVKYYAKMKSETFWMPIVMHIAEDWLMISQKMELNVLKNCNNIVQTWLLHIKVGMI